MRAATISGYGTFGFGHGRRLRWAAAFFEEIIDMKKFLLVAVGVAALAASACSKGPECTQEIAAKKAQDMAAALQAAITKDPSKAADLTAKAQAVTAKYQGATTLDEACKAYDELTATFKG
ncbi:hypothetical protein [Mesorhizobium sp. M2A.F.Ca.ET.043.05.1.1]|uniref:hypothetical protein n=1 Tax=Mesorhizobium sp. M2A.F.Ca.ET.043.05.1.1 TaxID=2493671 RepID=UPI001FDEFB48|nr:hypothetical protein [Mesorhizobium sp. M2A.F.Ca.ET.043.05.1.1]